MSANINYANGRHSFVSRKEVPWHKLGLVVEEAMTSYEAITLAGLDYEVGLGELWLKIPNELQKKGDDGNLVRGIKVPNYFATYRQDTLDYFGVVGSRYEVVQNREAFDFFDNIVQKKEAMFETAGALNKGEIIFVTAKLPSYIKVGDSDIIEKYILFTSTHDGSGTVQAMLTPIRVVCNNTLNLALRNHTNKINLKHTKNVHARLEEGAKLMGLVNKHSENLNDILNMLAKTPVTDEQVAKLIYDTYLSASEIILLEKAEWSLDTVDEISTRKKNIIQEVGNSIYAGVGQDTFKGTAYWLYNGFTTYYSNTKEYKDSEDRFDSLLVSNSISNTQQKIFDKVLTLVEN